MSKIYVCEYYFENIVDTKDIKFFATKEKEIDYAIDLLSSGKYSLVWRWKNACSTRGTYICSCFRGLF